MKIVLLAIKTILLLLFCSVAGWYGRNLPYESLMSIYGTLLNAGGLLFGIFGLWVGVLYPGIFDKSSDPNKYKDTATQSNGLLKPLFVSSLLFLVMLIVLFVAPFIKGIGLSASLIVIIKGTSAGGAAGIFAALLYEIIVSMCQVDCFQSIISRNEEKTDMKQRFMTGPGVSDDKGNNKKQDIG